MRIGGFQKLTLVDFPGIVAATVFTQGCNFRCGYCHNADLVLPELLGEPLPVELVFNYLSGRQGKIEGVVITGGEPTLQPGLADFIAQIKAMGFAVKLDTNGSHPEVLSTLIELHLIDYFALDIKTSFKKYPLLTNTACDTAKILESIHLIINSGVPYQLRTTLVKEFCSGQDLDEIQALIKDARHYALQPFVISEKMIEERFKNQSQYTDAEIDALKSQYEKY